MNALTAARPETNPYATLCGAMMGSYLVVAGQAANFWTSALTSRPGDVWARAAQQVTQTHTPAPDFGLTSASIGQREVPVDVSHINLTPFVQVWSFRADAPRDPRSEILIPHAYSGHGPTIHQHQIAALLPRHNVHLIAINDPYDVPLKHGRFALDDYIDTIPTVMGMREFREISTIFGTSQGGVMATLGAALLAAHPDLADGHIFDNLIVAGSPIYAQLINGMLSDRFPGLRMLQEWNFGSHATQMSAAMMVNLLSSYVPDGYAGSGRRIIKGETQQGCLKMMSDEVDVVRGRPVPLQALTAEAVCDTLRQNYLDNAIVAGTWAHRGGVISPKALTCNVMTIEAAHDRVVRAGWTHALLDPALTPHAAQRERLTVEGGHYHLVAGAAMERGMIAPMEQFMAASRNRALPSRVPA